MGAGAVCRDVLPSRLFGKKAFFWQDTWFYRRGQGEEKIERDQEGKEKMVLDQGDRSRATSGL